MNSLAGGWIVYCALVVALGWTLSCFHALNARGYELAFAMFALLAFVLVRRRPAAWLARLRIQATCRQRFRRSLPLMFLLITLLAVAGGFLYPPNNFDALTYRVPRMLSWISENHWHWIHTLNPRQNNRAPVYEWLGMPILLVTGSSRAFFLINAVSFALVPGLVFSVFTRLGIRPRVAWAWMWLLPSAYSMVLQAGGISNDMVATPFALAALDFALRARRSQRVVEVWLSVLAAALMTGVKGTNLPLLLPWLVALAPSWRLFFKAPLRSAGAAVLAGVVSFLPTAALNQLYAKDWSGAAVEFPPGMMPSPGVTVAVNALQLLVQNFAPPVFPMASWWNAHALGWLPVGLRSAIEESHFRGGSLLNLGELPIEDSAALGLGLMALLTISLGWVLARELRLGGGRAGRPPAAMVFASRFTSLLVWLPWVSLAVYTAKVATTCAGRLITPYYPLLLAGLLRLPGHEILVRRTWWRRAATGVLLLALSFVVVNPARPLWPAQTILAALQSQWPDNRLVERAARVYATYADRHDALAPIRDLLPASEQRVGLAGSLDCPEASLWRPFGSRKMIHMLPGDSTTRVREAGVEYVILTPEACELFQMSMEQWLREYNAEVVNRVSIAYLASHPPQTWLIVRLRQTRPEGDR